MESDEKVKAVVSILDEQVESLKNIIEKASKDGDFDTALERKNRWKERTARLIEKNIHPNEAEKLRKKRKGSFIMDDPLRNLADEGDMYIGFLKSLREALIEYPDDVIAVPTPTESNMPEIEDPSVSSSNDVFIIHSVIDGILDQSYFLRNLEKEERSLKNSRMKLKGQLLPLLCLLLMILFKSKGRNMPKHNLT